MSARPDTHERRALLGVDLGGTKALLGLFDTVAAGGAVPRERHRLRLSCAEFGGFDELLGRYLRQAIVDGAIREASDVAAACVGLAGPVAGGRAKLTNLPWEVDAGRVAAALGGARVELVNDFVAAAAGIEAIGATGLRTLQRGRADPGAPRLVVGAGTGLGTALIVPDAGGWRVLPGEGGHAGFAPCSAPELALLRWLRRRARRAATRGTTRSEHARTRVRWEDVVSGAGIESAFRFLAERDRRAARARPQWHGDEAHEGGDVREVQRARDAVPRARGRWPNASEIAAAALALGAAPAGDAHEARAVAVDARLAAAALDGFAAGFGAFAGDAALMTLPRGGVYVAGGIGPKVFDARRTGAFLDAFADKGGHAALLRALPVSLVLEPALGMLGAAVLAARARPAVC